MEIWMEGICLWWWIGMVGEERWGEGKVGVRAIEVYRMLEGRVWEVVFGGGWGIVGGVDGRLGWSGGWDA